MYEDFAPNFGDLDVASRQHTVSYFLFHQGIFFTKKRTRLSSTTYPAFLFPRLKVKLKDHHFDTVDVIEAESQVVNTLTEHDFQDTFKMAQALGTVHMRGRGLFRG
jgi:hypothetical protein